MEEINSAENRINSGSMARSSGSPPLVPPATS